MSLEVEGDPGAHCTRFRPFNYELKWTPAKNYVAGMTFELRAAPMIAFNGWRCVRIEIDRGDVVYRWKSSPNASESRANRDQVLLRARLTYGLRRGETCRILLTAIPPSIAGNDMTLSIWTYEIANNFKPDVPLPPAEKEAGSECTLHAVAGPVERLAVNCRPMPGPNGRAHAVIVPEDRFGNPSELEKTVTVNLKWQGEQWSKDITGAGSVELGAPQEIARLEVAVPMASLAAAENLDNATRERGALVVTGNPVWPREVDGFRPAFGEFHWHTDISGDGNRDIREGLRAARDVLNMDFAATGDHNPKGAAWGRTVAALEEFDSPGEFATFFGWENGTDRGHENYYFTDPDHPLVCGGSAGLRSGRPEEIVETLRAQHKFFAVAHHTNAVSGTRNLEDDTPFWHPYSWGDPVDYLRLAEVFQDRGNQECEHAGDAWRSRYQGNGGSIQVALERGYRLGFTGGTDNHISWPGRIFAKTLTPRAASTALTGVWCGELSRQGVYEALHARRTWAVWDCRALVHFSVNGEPMGGEIEVSAGTDLGAKLCISAEDALQTVEIVSEKEIVWQSSFSEFDIEVEVPLGKMKKSTHFYLRALQRDGALIYASPVFVDLESKS